ncbi:MAG: hypothetical protein JNL83_10450 [Myxococcales bacterium]|nr:hypothetical protein [Myxococcales bacterium]
MRALVAALVLLVPAGARADQIIELGGGIAVPMSDDEYTDYVETSPTLFARIGGGAPIGGLFSVDFTPLAAKAESLNFNRLRFQGHVTVRKSVAPKVELSGRFGAGLDLIHESFDVTILGTRFEGSDTDLGLALEVGGGAWFTVGASGGVQIGVEVALPISIHNTEGNPNNPNDPDDPRFDYTAVDLDVLGGVRLRL